MVEWTTQRISKENVEKVEKLSEGENFNAKLGKILESVDYWTSDLIEAEVEEKVEEALTSR